MGFLGTSIFGSNSGTGFQAQSGDIQTPDSIAQQQALVDQLNAQNGVANQSSVFNQLQGVASGTGPNPAQAMLAQQTGTNVANQAALMAGQRGAGANAGLIARQAAQQGAATQQQAVGQGATLQAQQSLGALGQLGGIAGQQVAEQQGGISNLNAQQMALQAQQLQNIQQQNQYNAGIAQVNAGAQQGRTSGFLSGLGSTLSNFASGSNAPLIGSGGGGGAFSSAGTAAGGGAGTSSAGTVAQGEAIGAGSGSSSLTMPELGSSAGFAKGGMVQNYDNGGLISAGASLLPLLAMFDKGGEAKASGPRSHYGRHLAGMPVKAMVSPGERYLPPKEAHAVAKGQKSPLRSGEKIPGQAKVKGDSLKNDTVPKTLEEGGVVIPRSILQSKHPEAAASKFVREHLKKGK